MDLSAATFLITGGTGSFGHAMATRLINSDVKEIRILSRDEKKQDDMRKLFGDSRLKFYLGDVRDFDAVDAAMHGVTHVFHAAALKQVPSCEFFPIEAVKTNVYGTENVVRSAEKQGVSRLVALSTDKAVAPVNAMGMSKALMEKVVAAKSRLLRNQGETVMCCTRYGNVIASRGSVVPHFADLIRSGSPLTITDAKMTRFMMTLSDAIELVLFAMDHAKGGEVFVRKSSGASLTVIVEALRQLFEAPNHPVVEIGVRHGEKTHETLVSEEEMSSAIDAGDYFILPMDDRDLNYEKFFSGGLGEQIATKTAYTSFVTDQLGADHLAKILREDEYSRSVMGLKEGG